ncbi:MAG: PEP-utilizing protein mobile subunit [Planctomycetaceae bacterium]|nr:PEP-utilizing protein mobile subunit [Planctomycetaceae bacterium]
MLNVEPPNSVLHAKSGPGTFWSTTNVGEAFPGVVTPLSWSLCGPSVEVGIRDAYARIGALPRREVRVPEKVEDRLISVFHGRGALNVNFFCRMGAHLPGAQPDAIARQFLGELPDEIPTKSSYRRLPIVAVKTVYTQATVKNDILRRTASVFPWWQQEIGRVATLDFVEAKYQFGVARDTFTEMLRIQAAGLFVAVQGVYDRLLHLFEQVSLDDQTANAILAGQGSHVETTMIVDLWRLAHGEIPMDEFLRRHGYHGPLEGEVSSTVWREDPEPVLRLARRYATVDEDPRAGAHSRQLARKDAERALIGTLPRTQRAYARMLLNAAVSRIPLRGVAKAAFLQALDVARGTARTMGGHLAARGVLASPEDVFYLTADELQLASTSSDFQCLVEERRAQRAQFESVVLPSHWQGTPVPISAAPPVTADSTVRGIGASGGVAEGTVRVVTDPAGADIEPGEIVVCESTDPSWASTLFLSSALVVDIGGLLSHAAVVAREIGVPCVIGTSNGTRALRTGDRVLVNGNTGTVEVIHRRDTKGIEV